MTTSVQRVKLNEILAQQNPTIDLRTEELSRTIASFLDGVDDYHNKAVEEITRRRQEFDSETKKCVEAEGRMEQEVADWNKKEIQLIQDLERERAERTDLQEEVSRFKSRYAKIRDGHAAVDFELDQSNAVVGGLRRDKDRDQKILNSASSVTSPQLAALESCVGLIIEGVQSNSLLFRFTNLSEIDPTRESSFVLDVSGPTFKVLTCKPHLATLPLIVDAFNEHRDLGRFVRDVRRAFIAALFSPT